MYYAYIYTYDIWSYVRVLRPQKPVQHQNHFPWYAKQQLSAHGSNSAPTRR